MVYPKNWEKVTCCDWCEDENKIWLCLKNKNAICEIDKISKEVKILGSFPHNGLGEEELSLSVMKCGNQIIFCPFKANDIAILNISTGKLVFIEILPLLNDNNIIDIGIEKFYRMISYKNYVCFLGIRYPVIMRLNLITNQIDFLDDWKKKIEEQKCKDAVFFTDGYAREENDFFFPIGNCSGALKVNLDTMEWNYIEVDSDVRGILGMTQVENSVWFTEHDIEAEKFYQWDLACRKVIQINLPSKDAYYAPLYYKKSLMFLGNYKHKSYRYETQSGRWEDISNLNPELEDSSDKKVRGEEIDFFSNKSGRFYHWNFQKNLLVYDEFIIKEQDFLENAWIDYRERCKKEVEDHITIEGKVTVRDYVEMIEMDHRKDVFNKENNSYGKRIFRKLMEG